MRTGTGPDRFRILGTGTGTTHIGSGSGTGGSIAVPVPKADKRRFLPCGEEDRMSNLPESVISLILEWLPFRDAVRTSTLSKDWRYKWTTMTSLVLDEQFSKKVKRYGDFSHNGFIRSVNHFMILHSGPISKFSLHIPEMQLDIFQEINQWMVFLSRSGVRELVLTNSSRRYKLPSHLSSFSELRKLKLENFTFMPPLKFEGLPNLEDLFLKDIDFRPGSCGIQANLPELRKLSLYSCTNVCNFKIHAQKLESLVVETFPDAMLLRLLDSPCLTRVAIRNLKSIVDSVPAERRNLAELLRNLPKIQCLIVDGQFCKLLSADNVPKWFPHPVDSLKHLSLHNFQHSDLDQLQGALSLLRNSPYLETLFMNHTVPRVRNYDAHYVGPASDHLESPDCLDGTLKHLLNVELETVEGSRPELLFIKLLLAHSPSLKKMTIQPSGTTDYSKRFNITKNVMQYPRASTKVEAIYLDPKS
ncbi:hypothetical protein OSB04_013670 [Centaurea solstitialis]|uniref:F-box domain-containing protein n=1 Tax=Centaurea solstitialis TaxID=347529 RepID=A0AA38WRE6_9ASTR|nr:hypothetical protein OSB04_013670 [Centaurea solstitialis]